MDRTDTPDVCYAYIVYIAIERKKLLDQIKYLILKTFYKKKLRIAIYRKSKIIHADSKVLTVGGLEIMESAFFVMLLISYFLV